MKACYNLTSILAREPTVLTIGAFDGIHRGHQQLIQSVVTAARVKRYRSVLVTFSPLPAVVLGRTVPSYITTNDEKLAALESLGLDAAVILEFTPEVARLRASEFVDRLIQQLDMRELWIGYDFALGARREGDAAFLQSLSGTRGFGFHSIPPVLLEGRPVSSTRIRNALRQGNIPEANACLGRPFRLVGEVVRCSPDSSGRGIAATVTFPTEHALPATGSYTCHARVQGDGQIYRGSVDIGAQGDTVATKRTADVHLWDCDSVRGQVLTLDFLDDKQPSLLYALTTMQSVAEGV